MGRTPPWGLGCWLKHTGDPARFEKFESLRKLQAIMRQRCGIRVDTGADSTRSRWGHGDAGGGQEDPDQYERNIRFGVANPLGTLSARLLCRFC